MKGLSKNNRGITLVALVITIIILLILATISIQSLTNTGLFARAKEARDKTQNAAENQAKTLNEYEDELNKYISGTVEKTFKGKTVTDAVQYADVLNKTDNTELQDAYGNKIVVPAGFKIISNNDTDSVTTVDKGIVIEDATSAATAGSQFVWIPVGKIYTDEAKTEANAKTITLGRYSFDSNGVASAYSDSYAEENLNDSTTLKKWGNTIAKNITNFKNSVASNGGYYIGRYEARTISIRDNKENPLTQITEKGTDKVYNYVTQPQAANQAQKMYSSTKFTSDLTNSYAWDTAIVFLQKCGTNAKYSRKTTVNNSLAQTGTNKQSTKDVQCNVYDMASNLREWTTETTGTSVYPCVFRGGPYNNSNDPASFRSGNTPSDSSNNVGFRPLLFIGLNS